jgi:MFS family permease
MLAFSGTAALATGLLIIGVLPVLAPLVILGALIGLGVSTLLTTLSTLISLKEPKEAQGGSLGIAWSLAALAQTIGPAIAATLFAVGLDIDLTGFTFIIAVTITLSTIPLLLALRKQEKQKPHQLNLTIHTCFK